MNILILIILIILTICFIVKLIPKNTKERYSNEIFKQEGKNNFQRDQLNVGRWAVDCYRLHPDDCLNYSNCGVCLKDGKKQCMPGDVEGPLFNGSCERWVYKNYYDRQIFKETTTTNTPPWSKLYPEYEAYYPSPISRATL